MTTELTADRVRELLQYNPETGVFTWKAASSNRVHVGDEAGSFDKDGYRAIRLDGRLHFSHRLAWLWAHGVHPSKELDHINRVRSDNRLSNLREATRSENVQNRLMQRNNTSGFSGVSWSKDAKRWCAKIKLNRKNMHLGYFHTPEAAYAAYLREKRALHPAAPDFDQPAD